MLDPAQCRARTRRLAERAALGAPGGPEALVICRPEHLLYLANLYLDPATLAADTTCFLLVRPEGDGVATTLFADSWVKPPGGGVVDEIIVTEWYDMTRPADARRGAVAEVVASRIGLIGARRLGAELAALPAAVARAGSDIVDVGAHLTSMREIKDADEIDAIRAAIAVAEDLHAAAREFLGPGQREIDLYAAIVDRATRRLGRPFQMLCDVVSGERALAMSGPPTGAAMERGDLVILDLFPCVGGYRADITATLAVGREPTAAQQGAFERVAAALEAGERALAPGAPVRDVFAAMDATLAAGARGRRAGDGDGGAGGRTLVHHGGHGLGLGHPEPPHIVPDSDRVLAAGMVVTLEPGLYDRDFGGIRLEHDFLVTEDGCERLSSHRLALA